VAAEKMAPKDRRRRRGVRREILIAILILAGSRTSRAQRVLNRPFIPPGNGVGPVASSSTISITSERCEGESLTNAFSSRRPSMVSLDGYPSFSLTSVTDIRFFISRLLNRNIKAGLQG
jgi:hypothetical protein